MKKFTLTVLAVTVLSGCLDKADKKKSTTALQRVTSVDENNSIKQSQKARVLYGNRNYKILYEIIDSSFDVPSLSIYTNKSDTLLNFKPNGTDYLSVMPPRLLKENKNYFIYVNEYSEGSGNLNKKHFYYLDTLDIKLRPVEIIEGSNVYKDSLKLKDNVFLKKGEYFSLDGTGQPLFLKDSLSFMFNIYKGDTLKRKGKYYKTAFGKYKIKKNKEGDYKLIPVNFEIEEIN